MPLPIVLALAAAGALAGGGMGAAAGGVYLLRRTTQRAAVEESKGDVQALAELLRAEIDLADLKRQARELGVDVAAVEAGYKAHRDGNMDVLSLAQGILDGSHVIPISDSAGRQKVSQAVGAGVQVVSDREIREWLRKQGEDVPASGRLGQRWKDMYRAAHEG